MLATNLSPEPAFKASWTWLNSGILFNLAHPRPQWSATKLMEINIQFGANAMGWKPKPANPNSPSKVLPLQDLYRLHHGPQSPLATTQRRDLCGSQSVARGYKCLGRWVIWPGLAGLVGRNWWIKWWVSWWIDWPLVEAYAGCPIAVGGLRTVDWLAGWTTIIQDGFVGTSWRNSLTDEVTTVYEIWMD